MKLRISNIQFVKIEKLKSIPNNLNTSYIFEKMKINFLNKKVIKIIISIILIAISYGFIIYKLIKFDEFKELSLKDFYQLGRSYIYLIIAILLMPINWSIETIKWQSLIKNIQIISFSRALKAVFSGISLGIFTPNRIGEIGGRIFYLNKGKRTFGLLATSLGSFSQLLTTIIAGLVGFAMLLIFFPDKTNINPIFDGLFLIVILIFLLILIYLYFNAKLLNPIFLKFSFFKKRQDQLKYFSNTKNSLLLKILFISMVRYLIFITQFYLLLAFLNIQISFLQAFISISLLYLFSTIIPTTTLLELGIKGSLAIFFIGLFSNDLLHIVLTTMTLWLINLVIPSIIGSIFFIKKILIK